MSNEGALEFVHKDQAITLKAGSKELLITKPMPVPEFIQGFLSPVIDNLIEAFPTCREALQQKDDIKVLWQGFTAPEKIQTNVEGIMLNEAITDIVANYAENITHQKKKNKKAYAPRPEYVGKEATKIGKSLLKVLSKDLSVQETMNLLGEALFLGNVDQLKDAYNQRKTTDDPNFDEFYKTSSDKKRFMDIFAPFLTQGKGGIIEDKRAIIFYASFPIVLAAARMFLTPMPKMSDVVISLLLIKSYKHLSYNTIAHALSHETKHQGHQLIGLQRLLNQS